MEVNRFFFFRFYLFVYFTLQYCIGFAIHQRESATGIHVVPILNLPLPPLLSEILYNKLKIVKDHKELLVIYVSIYAALIIKTET